MAQRYEYEIDDKAKEVAVRELNENLSQVNAHIESLRRWVNSMPHLHCPIDAKFLLRFLRVSKFDQGKAQKRIDNFCTARTSERGFPDYFKVLNMDDALIERFLKIKFVMHLGKIDSGESIVLVRFDGWDSKTLPFFDLVRLYFMGLDLIISEEDSQIFGVKFLVDMENVNINILEAICDPKTLKMAYVTFQNSYPIRFKGQLFCSDSALFDLFFHIILFFLNDKMKKRTFRISHDVSKVKDTLPGLDKILPKEYNGQGGTLDECAER